MSDCKINPSHPASVCNTLEINLDAPLAQRSSLPLVLDQIGDAFNRLARDSEETIVGEAVALRLEKGTHLNTGKYKINLRNYGNGIAEIGWSFVGAVVPVKALRGKSAHREVNEDRAVRRARTRIRQLILSVKADHLLTLTYRENVTDYGQACADLSDFVRRMKRTHPDWIYIGVAEQQKRGAWHWHLAVCGRQDVNLVRANWLRVVGDGNIDVSAPRGFGKQRMLSLVRYLGKYLSKGFADGTRSMNARRFRSSLGIVVPELSISLPRSERNNVVAYALDQLYARVGTVGHVWTSDITMAGWACSWK